jgi:flagellin-like hook-associated protein FlgL
MTVVHPRFTASGQVASGLDAERRRLLEVSGRTGGRRGLSQAGEIETVRRLVRLRAEARRVADRQFACADALEALSAAEEACAEIVTMIALARALVLRAVNASHRTARSREGVPAELHALRAGILAIANTCAAGRPVFGGGQPSGPAYGPDGTYVGATRATPWLLGPDLAVASPAGPDFFGTGDADLFVILAELAEMMRGVQSAGSVWGAVRALDSAAARIEHAAEAVTSSVHRVRAARDANSSRASELEAALVAQRTDSAALAMRIAATTLTYQVALHTLARIRQSPLFRFVK